MKSGLNYDLGEVSTHEQVQGQAAMLACAVVAVAAFSLQPVTIHPGTAFSEARVSAFSRRLPSSMLLGRFIRQGGLAIAAEENLRASPTLPNFVALERADPSPMDLLYAAPEMVEGRWLLTKTIAATVGEDLTSDSSVTGAVNASGLIIDTSAARVPVQEIDVTRGRIGNEIRCTSRASEVWHWRQLLSLNDQRSCLFATVAVFGQPCMVRVAGSFKADAVNGRRALVVFDTLDVFVLGESSQRVLRAGPLFSLIRNLKPALANGDNDASWLDTTYVSERMRLGRGNKGSIFILEKQAGGGPLDEWPL